MNLQDIPKLVINLSSRPDRLEQAKKELTSFEFTVIPGIKHDNPMLGIGEAHLNCIRHAQAQGWPNVMIIEDDIQFRPGYQSYMNEALEVLPADWDVLLGGVYEANKLEPLNAYWDRIGEFCGLHFYIVNQSAYDTILQYDGKLHIDRWMNYAGKRLKAYVTRKYFAIQRDGYSDNSKSITNYNDLYIKKHKLL